MKKLALAMLVLLLLLPLNAMAQQQEEEERPFYYMAPVQVEIIASGNRTYSYDCYPSAQHQGENRMAVYFNTPNGLAIYACELVGRTLIIPAVPLIGLQKAGLFSRPTVSRGGGA